MVKAGPLLSSLTAPGAEVAGERQMRCHLIHCLHHLCPSVTFPSGVLLQTGFPAALMCACERETWRCWGETTATTCPGEPQRWEGGNCLSLAQGCGVGASADRRQRQPTHPLSL